VLEGGIRVPFMVQWKGRIPAGKVYRNPVIQLDIHPTVVAAAGGATPSTLDGVNLLPFLTGQATGRPHDRLFWRFGPQGAIRSDNWKALHRPEGEWELYDLAADIGETTDLARKNPAKAKELVALYNDWNAQLAAPGWGNSRRRAGAGKKGRKKR
jgi:arylsulfatase A-like enzyme